MSQHEQEVEVDVAATFDNCFFHCYALHVLGNQCPFPEDLFTFDSILGGESPAKQLQELFSDEQSLDGLFAEYNKSRDNPERAEAPNFIVEKTMVLGILLREWFATKLSQDERSRDSDQFVSQFIALRDILKDYPEEGRKQWIDALELNHNPAYQANQDFFNDYFARDFQSQNEAEQVLKTFWLTEGYQNYCKQLAQLGTKIAIEHEIQPVLDNLGQPLKLLDSNEILSNNDPAKPSDPPCLEIKLDAQEGHYYLLKTKQTEAFLGEYQKSYERYRRNRTDILALDDDDKQTPAKKSECLFLAATIPAEYLEETPFALLLDKLQTLKRLSQGNCSPTSPRPTSLGLTAGSRNLYTSLDPAVKPREVGRGRASTSQEADIKAEELLEEQPREEQPREEQRREEQRREEQRREEQRLEEQRLEEQRLEEQRLEEQRLEEQRLEEQRLEEQRLEEQRLEEQRLEEQRLEEQRLEEQRLEAHKNRLGSQATNFKGLESELNTEKEQFEGLLAELNTKLEQLQKKSGEKYEHAWDAVQKILTGLKTESEKFFKLSGDPKTLPTKAEFSENCLKIINEETHRKTLGTHRGGIFGQIGAILNQIIRWLKQKLTCNVSNGPPIQTVSDKPCSFWDTRTHTLKVLDHLKENVSRRYGDEKKANESNDSEDKPAAKKP